MKQNNLNHNETIDYSEDSIDGKRIFFERIEADFLSVLNSIGELDSFKLSSLNPKNTVLVIVDVINGFVREGALHSSRMEEIISPILNLMDDCSELGIQKIAFADCHQPDSKEFEAFPIHCLKNSSESQVIDEIKENGGYTLIEKNSTNGFHAPDFQRFLAENPNVENYIVCGDCTDICVMNFCITLKTYFDQINKSSKIIIPINAVETYDIDLHHGDFMNILALQFMKNAGMIIANDIVK